MLLAEDDGATAEMYRIGLEAAGFRVRVAADVTAVFEAMETQIPDVAVLDYHLSGIITGLDILDNIRLDVRAESLPVLMLSNESGRDGERDRARRAGALAWLCKHETDPLRLAARVSEALDNCDGRSSSRPAFRIESRRIVRPQTGDGLEHGHPEASASQRNSPTADGVDADGRQRRQD